MDNQQSGLDPEFKPHDAVDLTDQSTMFLVLEELGIAHMQDAWLQANDPANADAAQVAEQAREFFADLCGILCGRAGPERVVANGWAGAKLAAHLRASAPAVTGAEASDEEAVANALRAYLASLDKLTAREAAEKAAGRELSPKDYIDLMAAWSGLFCGLKSELQLDAAYLP